MAGPRQEMFAKFQPWVLATYGDSAKTKTITLKKAARIQAGVTAVSTVDSSAVFTAISNYKVEWSAVYRMGLTSADCLPAPGAAAGGGPGLLLRARGQRGRQVPAVGEEQGAELDPAWGGGGGGGGSGGGQGGLSGAVRAHGDRQGEP